MRTVVVRVLPRIDRDGGGVFPVRLYLLEPDGKEPPDSLAEAFIPGEWTAEQPPNHPGTGLPFNAESMRQFVLSERNPSNVFGEIGAFLFRLLLRDDVYKEWDAQLQRSSREEPSREGIRTVLDIEPEGMRSLPWELMYHHPHRPFTNTLSPVVRGRINAGIQPPPYCWPIRVLIVVGCRETDKIQWKEELHGIEDALLPLRHAVDCEVLSRPSRVQLFAAFENFRPDIFHFIGHGRGGSRGARLEFFHGNAYWSWTVDEIVADLREHPPKLAIVNACHSAAHDDQHGAWSVTEAFAAIGTLAVLGMYGDVPGGTAATFSAEMYDALAAGKLIDVAVAHARGAVSRSASEDGYFRRDWSLASLVVSILPDRVLQIEPELPERFERVRQIPEFLEIRDFVDRTDQRRKVWRTFSAVEPRTPDLLLIRGEHKAGLSGMLRWCLQTCALHGHHVSFRDFRGGKTRMFSEVLRLIVEGDPAHSSPLRQPLDFATFKEFRTLLSAFPGSHAPAAPTMAPVAVAPDRLVPALFEAFRTGLIAASQGQPLTFALDHLFEPGGIVLSDFAQYLRPYFLSHVARGELRPVRLIVTATESEYRDYGLETLAVGDAVLEIRKFQFEEFMELLPEFLRFHASREESAKIAEHLGPLLKKTVKGPSDFRAIKDLVVHT